MYLLRVYMCVCLFPVTWGFTFSSTAQCSSCAAGSLQGSTTSEALCGVVIPVLKHTYTLLFLTSILHQCLSSLLAESSSTAKTTITVPHLSSTTKNSPQLTSHCEKVEYHCNLILVWQPRWIKNRVPLIYSKERSVSVTFSCIITNFKTVLLWEKKSESPETWWCICLRNKVLG